MKLYQNLFNALFLISALSGAVRAQNTLDLSTSFGISKQLSESETINGRVVKDERPALAYRIGASYSAKIGYRTHVCVGGNYTSLATRNSFDPNELRWGSQWSGTAFDPSLPSGENFSKTVNISRESQFELPVTFRRYLNDSQRFYVLAGIVPALHIRYVNIIKQEGGERQAIENTTSDFESFQLATKIGVGAEFPVSEMFKFFSQLNGQVHLLEEEKDSGLRWWDISAQVGVRLGI